MEKGGFRPVPVWDGIVRATHWVNALCVAALLVLGGIIWLEKPLGLAKAAKATITDLHAAIGFAFAASLGLRLAYLVSAPKGPASWRDLVPLEVARRAELVATLRYYLGGLRGTPPLYFAHNALAGLAYLGFFALGLVQVSSGAAMYLLAPGRGAAYAHEGHEEAEGAWPPEWLHELHEAGALFILLFVLLHLVMVALHEIREQRGLISGMVSGCKFFREEELAKLGMKNQRKGGEA